MISGKEMHMKKVPTEPNCDLIVPLPLLGVTLMQKIDRGEFGIPELKLISLPIRSGWSPWHDSYPRGSRSIPPPPVWLRSGPVAGSGLPLSSDRPAVGDSSGHFSGVADRLSFRPALCK